MVLDDLSQKERQGIGAALALVAAVALMIGYAGASLDSPTGDFSADSVSTDEIRDTAQSLVDRQVSAQEQQMALMAGQSENISQEDLSMSGEVTDVSESDFPSLYEVTISITGTTVSQTGEVQELDEEQSLYISKDGKYMFQPPTDLEEAAQQRQQQQQTEQAPQPTPEAPSEE